MSLTLLEEYIESGNAAAIDNLLHTNPALCQQKTSHEISPLLLACYYNKHQIVKIILQHIQEINIFEAAAAGLTEVVSELLEESPELLNTFSEHGFTPLGMATHFGNTEIVRYLLIKGADVNLPSQNGYNVYPLHAAVGSNFDEIAKMLVEAGAEVNVLQSSRSTPLHTAAQHGNIEMLILLLENGAQTDIKNDFGKTAADLAAEKGFAEIANILS
ncbi:MAG TPA: ankyrin repeat domain-containing protein [Pseudosphingobacterium sp.]|nr:ankyrin repeat domain-containing protein [Pseudosphingobacterium sp.]